MEHQHQTFMQEALKLASKAANLGEVPVGALVVKQGQIIGHGFNLRETDQSPLAHAEILAITKASQHLSAWRLIDCDIYITLEPCLMCAGALIQSRIRGIYFGAFDPKGGAMGSLYEIHKDLRLNHQPKEVIGGILEHDCATLLKTFFKQRRLAC